MPPYPKIQALYLSANYGAPGDLDEALQGVDVVINLLGMYPESWAQLGEAAYRTGASLYIPSEFGPDHRSFDYQSPFEQKRVQSEQTREKGIKSVQIFCGVFMEHALPVGRHLGIDLPGRSVTAVVPTGGSDPRVSFTSVTDVAMTIASVACRRPSVLPDAIQIASGTWTLRQLGEYYQSLIGATVHVTTQDYLAFRESVLNSDHQSPSSHYQLAAGAGLLDYSTTNSNDWVSAGMWEWRSIQQHLTGI
ncbi:unnamed protein product [Tuber aestivum]|uniref:NmrA-like domain-containing protein n=1 Tax=Tuber aestivum TaxID=59557 RepID=A0A292PK70_9PEZI|nr:unnamed protein product [Tuber aestivum]